MRFHLAPIVGLLALVAACGGESSDVADESDLSAANHASAVRTCTKTRDRALDSASSNSAMQQATVTWTSCVRRADDSVAPRLEKNLAAVSSPDRGGVAKLMAAYRTAAGVVCDAVSDASESFGGFIATLQRADCRGEAEAALAALIDAYADLGKKAVSVVSTSEDHAKCNAAFDADTKTASTTAAQVTAARNLAGCIEHDVALHEPTIVKRIVDNKARPKSTPDQITKEVHDALVAHGAAARHVCAMLSDTGSSAGGTLAHVEAAMCTANAAAQLADNLVGK